MGPRHIQMARLDSNSRQWPRRLLFWRSPVLRYTRLCSHCDWEHIKPFTIISLPGLLVRIARSISIIANPAVCEAWIADAYLMASLLSGWPRLLGGSLANTIASPVQAQAPIQSIGAEIGWTVKNVQCTSVLYLLASYILNGSWK